MACKLVAMERSSGGEILITLSTTVSESSMNDLNMVAQAGYRRNRFVALFTRILVVLFNSFLAVKKFLVFFQRISCLEHFQAFVTFKDMSSVNLVLVGEQIS